MNKGALTANVTLIELLKKYNRNTFPVANFSLDHLDDEPQDKSWTDENMVRNSLGEDTAHASTHISNVETEPVPFNRQNSYFSYFLDGCRRSYYLCDMSTASGSLLPILAGQVSSAVLKRDRASGRVSLHRYARSGLLLIPAGGNALNTDDANEIKSIIDLSFVGEGIKGKCINIRHSDNPKDDALAHLNMEMQSLEIRFLEQLAITGEIDQDNMIVVDGALQFQRLTHDQISNLRYAVGLSKHFNLHLRNVVSRDREIGTLLIDLREVGDRTVGFRLHLDNGTDYAFWYLRMRPREHLGFPFAGIVKLEKVLISPKEKEDGLPSDVIDNISRCILLERTVCPYGLDFRWASHIYPIYLTEQIQKRKFTTDFIYSSLLRRKVQA